MKFFKRNSRLITSDQMKSWLRPKIGNIGDKYKLAARIRLANRWATRHPKSTFGYVVGVLLTVFIGDVMLSGIKAEMNEADVNTIAHVEPVFNGFRTIQANKDIQRKNIMELTSKGLTIKNELDSLIALPRKTHSDSLVIIKRYRELETIAKSL